MFRHYLENAKLLLVIKVLIIKNVKVNEKCAKLCWQINPNGEGICSAVSHCPVF